MERLLLQKTLKIQKKLLPPIHPELAVTYKYLMGMCGQTGDFLSMLSYSEKLLEIQEIILPSTSPDLAQTKSIVTGLRLMVRRR